MTIEDGWITQSEADEISARLDAAIEEIVGDIRSHFVEACAAVSHPVTVASYSPGSGGQSAARSSAPGTVTYHRSVVGPSGGVDGGVSSGSGRVVPRSKAVVPRSKAVADVPCITCGVATASCGDRCRYCAGVRS